MTFEPPIFAIPDALQAEQDLEAQYNTLTGKKLFPAQPEKLLSNLAAYLKTVVDALIQFTGEQNLVNFAIGDALDQIGVFWDEARLPPEPAITTLEFTLTSLQPTPFLIPAGTRVRSNDNIITFETTEDLTIPVTSTTGTVEAKAQTTGEIGNDYAIGSITTLFDIIPNVDSVSNTTISNSGSPLESDDRYRERLKLAPNKVNSAGSLDSYRFLALSADNNIIDVGIESPNSDSRLAQNKARALELAELLRTTISTEYGTDVSGFTANDIHRLFINDIRIPRFTVDIYLLTNTGVPSANLITKVQNALDANTVRPLTDVVRVLPAQQLNRNIVVNITARTNADTSTLQSRLETLLDDYAEKIQNQLGFDIVRSQIIDTLRTDEVYDVEVVQPASNVTVAFNQRPFILVKQVNIVGVKED